ncbi:hypothetical protein LOD99_3049 [Oopsacas minuta]|uniref:Uncharacterized protein n=1 Tax=Oopsacas minuta TaxID=111878 RepID=A0AAV7K0T1_9METZ|nr:hypothetical protein LOD99_3049 [Oopsacas minuta]
MGNSVGRVKDWMGMGPDPIPPRGQCVRRQVRMDDIDIRHYLVYWVKSSLYRDSEGSVGHEFYEEEVREDLPTGAIRRGMRRVTDNLTHQEREELPYPALSSKLPVVFYRVE